MAKLIAACNITGPNGELIIASDPEANVIPDGWPEEFIEDMKRGGAIVEVEDDFTTVADIVPEEEA